LRAHQVNGGFEDITLIRWVYSDSAGFPELIDVLAVAAGEPPSDFDFDCSNLTVSVLPDRLLHREPREVMRDELATEFAGEAAAATGSRASRRGP
jgi:hypothetical protein